MKKNRWLVRPIVVAVGGCFGAVPAWANPTGPQVINGAVQFQGLGTNQLKVTNSPNAIIHWQGFSIGAGQLTQFQQQSASSAVLNRVVGPDISSIQGSLVSNGRVFLINPAGIIVGPGGVIDTAGFVGSTLKMLDADFLAGRLRFQGEASAGEIVNQGLIKVGQAGNVILAAPHIYNSGTIRAEGGNIVLAAGQKMTIGNLRLEGIQFEIQAPADSALNVGKLLAEDGAVGVFAGTLKHTGDIRATALTRDDAGRVVLKSQKDTVLADNATISVDNAAGKGGSVQVLGERVGLFGNSTITARGANGGGEILVGGDYKGGNPLVANATQTVVGPGVTLDAGATHAGDGGKVVVWADDTTRFYGTISARGGMHGGDGGFVETSGKEGLTVIGAHVDTGAPAGRAGNWLLDPKNITVQNGAGGAATTAVDGFSKNAGGNERIEAVTINNVSVGTVTLQANNDITFTDPITNTFPGVALTAQAGRSILVNADISMTADITLTANDAGATFANRDPGLAQLTMQAGRTINAGAGVVRFRMGVGPGVGTPNGNITIANAMGSSVSTEINGPTANASILRADSASLITVANGGTVHLEIEQANGGSLSSIGTSSAPMRITAGAGNTAILESHYHGGGAGIFIDSQSNLQIGGADPAVFNGTVKGVQTLNESTSGVAPGPVTITVNGELTQQAGTAGCNGVTGTGGPICAGSPGSTNALDILTLRASDITLNGGAGGGVTRVAGNSVILLPLTGDTIGLGAAAAGTLQIDQAELNLINTTALRIGETASGTLSFDNAGITAPAGASIDLRSGGNIVSGGGALDVSTAASNRPIALTGRNVGATGAGRIKVNPGTSTVDMTATAGSVFIEQAAGDMRTSRYTFSGTDEELATTDGDIVNDAGFTINTTPNVTLLAGVGTATARNIVFSGAGSTTAAGTLFTLTPNAAGSTQFTSGTQIFMAPVSTTRPIVVNGGAVTFNNTLTTNGLAGTVDVNSGTMTVNGSATLASGLTVTGTGTLAGSGPVAANDGLTFTGGTISNTGTVTIATGVGGTGVTSGTPQLSGTLSTDQLGLAAGATLTIGSSGLLIHRGAASSMLDGTLNITGTMRVTGAGNLVLSNAGAALTINAGGLLDFQADASLIGDIGAPPATVTNNGTVRKSGGSGATHIGSTGPDFDINFVNSGRLNAQTGFLDFSSPGNVFSNNTTFDGAGTNRIVGNSAFNGNILADNLLLQSGNFSGSASFSSTLPIVWRGGVMTGAHTILGGAILNLDGPGAKLINGAVILTNAGTTNLNDGSLFLGGGATFLNTGTFNIPGALDVANSGTPTFFMNAGGTINKTGAGTSLFGNIDKQLTVTNTAGGTISVQNGTLQMNAAFPDNNARIETTIAGATFSTNGASLNNLSNGIVAGLGTMNLGTGTLTNSGTVAPGSSPGALAITGNYTQTSTGRLVTELAGAVAETSYDVLHVNGAANLDGILQVVHSAGFSPTTGQPFDIVTYASHTGDFSSPSLPSGFAYTRTANPTFYQIAVSGVPATTSSSRPLDVGNTIVREQERLLNDLPPSFDERDPRPSRQSELCK